MLNRRNFLALPLLAAIPTVGSSAPTPLPPLPPREFHRYDYATDSWTKITPGEMRAGDVVRMFDPPDGSDRTLRVTEVEPEQFYSDIQIDPTTNRWVPCNL